MDRNLDGIYFRVQRDGKWGNACFSDLSQEEMERVMENRDVDWLKSMCIQLGKTIRRIGDELDIVCEQQRKQKFYMDFGGSNIVYDCLKCRECVSMIACPYCDDGSEFVRMSNAEHIRMMNDEELAKFLTKITDDAQLDAKTKCDYQWDEWLKEEVCDQVFHKETSGQR